ncbi:MAG: PP2C family protein-serine/threonine phosphatase [Acidimicrobiales bacterium]
MRTYEINPAGVTDIGNVRPTNEDHLLATGDLFVVADGMGGQGRGEAASRLATETLQVGFESDPTGDGLLAAVGRANSAVINRADTDPELQGMGTTIAAVAAVVEQGQQKLAVVNVGDSRVYLLRAGSLERLSSDHSVVADLVRAGEISEAEAFSHPERHRLTQALGVEPVVEPFVAYSIPVAGDRLLLCSDGLFNELTAEQITGVLTSVGDPAEAASALVSLAKDHGGSDNITTMVLDIAELDIG